MAPDLITHTVQTVLGAITPVRGESLSKNVVQLIKEDHDRVRSLYEQYKLPGTTASQKRMLAWAITREVSIHSAKEEEVVYPAMRDSLGDLTPDHLLSEHQQLKELLTELNNDTIADPNFDGKLQEIMEVLLHHMMEEEEVLLPRFAAAEGVASEYLMQLGRLFEQAKLHAPSRPHPWAPNKPPLNIAANASVAPLDFVRDLIRFEGAPPL
jgi:hemerythrin superfamily protein